jgi:hypothetical protein
VAQKQFLSGRFHISVKGFTEAFFFFFKIKLVTSQRSRKEGKQKILLSPVLYCTLDNIIKTFMCIFCLKKLGFESLTFCLHMSSDAEDKSVNFLH